MYVLTAGPLRPFTDFYKSQRNKFEISEIFEGRKKGYRKRWEEGEEKKRRGGAALCICYPHPSGAGSMILRVGIHENLPDPKTKMYN